MNNPSLNFKIYFDNPLVKSAPKFFVKDLPSIVIYNDPSDSIANFLHQVSQNLFEALSSNSSNNGKDVDNAGITFSLYGASTRIPGFGSYAIVKYEEAFIEPTSFLATELMITVQELADTCGTELRIWWIDTDSQKDEIKVDFTDSEENFGFNAQNQQLFFDNEVKLSEYLTINPSEGFDYRFKVIAEDWFNRNGMKSDGSGFKTDLVKIFFEFENGKDLKVLTTNTCLKSIVGSAGFIMKDKYPLSCCGVMRDSDIPIVQWTRNKSPDFVRLVLYTSKRNVMKLANQIQPKFQSLEPQEPQISANFSEINEEILPEIFEELI